MAERDPNGLDSKQPGSKLDDGKSPILRGCLQYFPRALKAVAAVSQVGAKKYSWKGWEKVDDGINRYGDALVRHLIAEETDGPVDADTGRLHAEQVAWNALARLELILREGELPKPGSIVPCNFPLRHPMDCGCLRPATSLIPGSR